MNIHWLVFLGPALLLFATFTAYPVLRTIYNSFFAELTIGAREFVGFRHYLEILTEDDIAFAAAKHSLIWGITGPLLEVPLAFLIAVGVTRSMRGAKFVSVAWFAPYLISPVVVGSVWMWIYNYDWGLINAVLRFVGAEAYARPWLGNLSTALPALIVVTTWMSVGFSMVVLISAIGAIPPSILEAAQIDGAGWFRSMRYMVLPLVMPAIVKLSIFSFIAKMKQFGIVWVMTNGGPLWSTETVSTYIIKRAFNWKTFDLGYPSALATLWFLAILLSTIGLTWLASRRDAVRY